ncbi:MAG: hypothetical protein KF729_20855 [Sandaracinaceae bacterium]|nr:hypothetical protein [Sandaracinaceae bacterium]
MTRERLLPEALGRYPSLRAVPAPVALAVTLDAEGDADAFGDLTDFEDDRGLAGEDTRILLSDAGEPGDDGDLVGEDTRILPADAGERGDTTETALPEGGFEEVPTYVEANRHDAPTTESVAPLDAPERTVEIVMPEARGAPERATDPPALPAAVFVAPPARPSPLARLARVEVMGWPLVWIVGLALGALTTVALVAWLTATLAR